MRIPRVAAAALACLVATGVTAQTAPSAVAPAQLQERLTDLKELLAQNRKSLHGYTWVETTAVSYKGEVKSTTRSSCSIGPDGSVQKVQLSVEPPPDAGTSGFIARKRAELRGTVKAAMVLLRSYVPLDAARLQKCKDAGKAAMSLLAGGKLIRLVFRDYALSGDIVTLTLDAATNRVDLMGVSTYVEDASTVVTFDVRMAALPDGTSHTDAIQLAIPPKDLTVAITNSDYKPKS